MARLLPFVLVLCAIAFVIYLLAPRPLFVLRIERRKFVVKKGKVPANFVRDCEQMLADSDIPESTIKGFAKGRQVTLHFSSSMPDDCRQTFRNIWSLNA